MEHHPEEAAAHLDLLSLTDLVEWVESAPPSTAGKILSLVEHSHIFDILSRLSDVCLVEIVKVLEPAKAMLIFRSLDDSSRQSVFSKIPSGLRKELEALLSYEPGTAGALMDSRVLSFLKDVKVSSVLSQLRKAKDQRIFEVFVVDSSRYLVGRALVQDLAIADQRGRIEDHIQPIQASVNALSPVDEVAKKFEQYKLTTLPVLHITGELLGVIRHNDLVASVQDQISADMVAMVGGSPEERALSSSTTAVKKRLPWLLINLLTAFLASAVVGIFEDTIAKISALAVLLPVVAGQSGNTGAQAMAVTMRGLALREILVRHWARLLWKECGAGFLNGVVVAIATSVSVVVWSSQLALGAVIGVAMVISMIMASIAGVAVPLVLVWMGRDPAQSSSIILTTITDVMGFLSFLGLATLLASLLVSA